MVVPSFDGDSGDTALIWDLPFDSIVGISARNTVNNIKITASISRHLVINMVRMPLGEAPKQANSPKPHHFGSISMHRNR